MTTKLSRIALLLAGGIFFYAALDLPRLGDPDSPPQTHVSPRYIAFGHAESGAANFVTNVLADYRGYDTLGETTVILTAGLTCVLLLGLRLGPKA